MFVDFIFECRDFDFVVGLKRLLLADFMRRDWFASSSFGKIHKGEFQISCGNPEKFKVDNQPREHDKEDGQEVNGGGVFFEKVTVKFAIRLE